MRKGYAGGQETGREYVMPFGTAYRPGAFDVWKKDGNVYGACQVLSTTGLWMDERFLGVGEPEIGELVEAMLEYNGEKMIFHTHWEGELILNYLLSGTEDLWGMVDWEEGECDFQGELFTRMLAVSRRYADDNTWSYPVMSDWFRSFSIYHFKTEASRDYLKEEAKLPVGYLFDDGWHMGLHESSSTIVAISAPPLTRRGSGSLSGISCRRRRR